MTTPAQSAEDPSVPSTVLRLDVTDGTDQPSSATPRPAGCRCARSARTPSWASPPRARTSSAAVVGPAQVAAVTWDEQDSVVGCSADGRFLYVQRIPQPPTEETEDTEPPNPSTALERITLADGSRTEVLALDPGRSPVRSPGSRPGAAGRGHCRPVSRRRDPPPCPATTAASPSPIVRAA